MSSHWETLEDAERDLGMLRAPRPRQVLSAANEEQPQRAGCRIIEKCLAMSSTSNLNERDLFRKVEDNGLADLVKQREKFLKSIQKREPVAYEPLERSPDVEESPPSFSNREDFPPLPKSN